MKKITTVVFDIGNVLAGFDWPAYLQRLGFSEETGRRIAGATFLGNNWKEVDRGVKSDEDIYEDCLREIPDLKEELAVVWAGRTGIVKEFDYAAEWILSLKRAGYRVYLLSNYGRETFAAARAEFSFFEHVDGMVISYEIRHIKPEPEIYEELIRRYDIIPEETVFLDDLQPNIEAAKAFGFHTILFTEKTEAEKRLLELGVPCEPKRRRERVYTRIDILRKHVDRMLLQNTDDEDRRCGYVHLYGVGMAAALLAYKRGFDPELAEMAGILHDYISYQGLDGPDHAHRCEPVVRALLEELAITSEEETEMICSAVYHHSDKAETHSAFDEIIKDADVMQHWLRNPKEPIWYHTDRVERLRAEFGLAE